jgi:hypothetical protein
MTTINDLEQINTMAMMTMCELGYARYERFRAGLKMDEEACDKLRQFVYSNSDMEHELELRIKVAPMYKKSVQSTQQRGIH